MSNLTGNLQRFIADVKDRGFFLTSKFEVMLVAPTILTAYPDATDFLALRASSVNFPSINFNTVDDYIDIDDRRKYVWGYDKGEIIVNFYVDAEAKIINIFDYWKKQIIEPNTGAIGFYQDYAYENYMRIKAARNPSSKSGDEISSEIEYTFYEVFPKVIGEINLSWQNSQIAILPVTFGYRKMLVKKNDTVLDEIRKKNDQAISSQKAGKFGTVGDLPISNTANLAEKVFSANPIAQQAAAAAASVKDEAQKFLDKAGEFKNAALKTASLENIKQLAANNIPFENEIREFDGLSDVADVDNAIEQSYSEMDGMAGDLLGGQASSGSLTKTIGDKIGGFVNAAIEAVTPAGIKTQIPIGISGVGDQIKTAGEGLPTDVTNTAQIDNSVGILDSAIASVNAAKQSVQTGIDAVRATANSVKPLFDTYNSTVDTINRTKQTVENIKKIKQNVSLKNISGVLGAIDGVEAATKGTVSDMNKVFGNLGKILR